MKAILFLLIMLLFPLLGLAQVDIGISVQPGILANRVSEDINGVTGGKDGSKPRIWVGIFIDKELRENYHFLTGIYWAPKRLGMRISDESGSRDLNVKLQYVQVPLILKLLTDEIALDKKIYFQVGPAFDIKVNDSPDEDLGDFYIKKINFWDVNLHFGAGMEFRVGYNTRLSAGFSYYRGLVNILVPESSYKGDLRAKNDFYGLNCCIMF